MHTRLVVVFFGSGFVFTSCAAHLPQIRASLGLAPAQLGLLLLSVASGSVLSMPMSGLLIERFGSRRVLRASAFIACGGVAGVGIAYRVGVVPTAGGLCAFGFGSGLWDVAMNVEGAHLERVSGRARLARLFAFYSVGSMTGAAIGAGTVACGLPVTVHLLLATSTTATAVHIASAGFGARREPEPGAQRNSAREWTEPRTLALGLLLFCMALSEAIGNDWIGVGFVDGHAASAAVGGSAFAVFLVAMTVGRWYGPEVIARHGPRRMLRLGAVGGTMGVLCAVFAGSVPLAIFGVAVWGLGTSLGFPIALGAAADTPARAAARVSVVATIGYTAFLGGPPSVGALADGVGTLHALLAAALVLGVAWIAAAAVTG